MIPVGPEGGFQKVMMVQKDMKGKVTKKSLFGVVIFRKF
jgi:hypothetical protein